VNELALFAGAGGGILGGKLIGWRTVCAVEIDSYARKVLLARQADGCLEPFPIWDDVTTFDGNPWRGRVDVVSGGFPCQDISAAGKGAGLDGERSGLWTEMARIVGEVQPAFVWVENSPMLLVRGIDRVLWDLAAMGYDARWGVLGGAHVGARTLRERIWICACSNGGRWDNGRGAGQASQRDNCMEPSGLVSSTNAWNGWNDSTEEKCKVLGVADGVAGQLDRIRCLGNGQVPAVVALAWRILTAGLPMTGNEAGMSVQRLETCMPNASLEPLARKDQDNG